jgi:hypothetical protein
MLESLGERASERKLRLFAVACCRQPTFFSSPKAQDRAAILLAEQYADGPADQDQLRQARQQAWHLGPSWCCASSGITATRDWIFSADRYGAFSAARRALLADLLREFFGDPLNPLRVDPTWLRWQDSIVHRVAQAVYEERHLLTGHLDQTRLAVLADALEEAGCDNALILGHLRAGGPHHRGCHVVDALLEKG